MEAKKYFSALKIRWLIIFIILSACVDRINFDVPPAQFQIVIEGMISDDPGPYTVKVSKGLSLDSDLLFPAPVQHAKIRLYDDEGNSEDFKEITPGEYITAGIIQGQIGHAYHIRVETLDGKVFESEPDRINPVGEVQNIRYEFEARMVQKSFGSLRGDVFNIYLDAYGGEGDENYVRWRFKGTYKVVTNPELRVTYLQGEHTFKDPLPCSGYIVKPALLGGLLFQDGECTCCICWVNQFEEVPLLSDGQLITNNQFKNIKIAEVPINSATFYDKFRIEVEQMSLSRKAFEFFRLVRAQKEGASSLFQPPSGEITGNISAINSSDPVVGIFWATSVKKNSLFILRSEVPYLLTPIDIVTEACTTHYPNSSTVKPQFWE